MGGSRGRPSLEDEDRAEIVGFLAEKWWRSRRCDDPLIRGLTVSSSIGMLVRLTLLPALRSVALEASSSQSERQRKFKELLRDEVSGWEAVNGAKPRFEGKAKRLERRVMGYIKDGTLDAIAAYLVRDAERHVLLRQHRSNVIGPFSAKDLENPIFAGADEMALERTAAITGDPVDQVRALSERGLEILKQWSRELVAPLSATNTLSPLEFPDWRI